MNTPVQLALPAWLSGRHALQRQILARAGANLVTAESLGVQTLKTEAGWAAVLRSAHSSEGLIVERAVVTHPGSFYGMSEANRLVVSLLTPEADFALGIERIMQT
jgi:hypothetical protein